MRRVKARGGDAPATDLVWRRRRSGSPNPVMRMMMRIPVAVLAFVLVGSPAAAQTGAGAAAPGAASATTPVPHVVDPRLAITISTPERPTRPEEAGEWADVTRPRWRYPAIGAAVGVAAGLIHGHVIMQGDPIGLPVDPRY